MFSIETENKIKFVEKVFGSIEKGTKNNIQVFCPNCIKLALGPVKKRKLAIAYDKNFIVKCWVCGYKNSFLGCLYEFFGRSIYFEYIKKFKVEKFQFSTEENEKKTATLPDDFRLILFDNSYSSRAAKKYFFSRGGTEKDLWFFRLGISDHYLYKNRIIMPSFDSEGDLNCVCARDITGLNQYKYINSDVDKNSIIFNELHIDWYEEITITEGMFDLIKCNENAVPLLGSNLVENSYLFAKIIKHGTPVLLALDSDATKKAMKLADIFISYEIKVRFMNLKGYSDVGSMTKKDFKLLSKDAISWGYDTRVKNKIDSLIKSGVIL